VLSVGSSPTATALADGGLLASDPSGDLHLLWHDRRYAIAQPDLFAAAFTWPKASAVPIAPAVLNAIPAGTELRSLDITRTEKASAVGGFKVGEVFVVKSQGGSSVFGVALEGGVADITQVQADLLVAKGNNGSGGAVREMGQAQFAAAVALSSLVPKGDAAPPAKTPQQARTATKGGVCATFTDAATAPAISLAESVPPFAGEVRAVRGSTDTAGSQGASTVDWIAVPPGRAAVVEALAGPTSPGGALGIVSDLGLRFPVPSRDVLGVLGYASVTPQRLPAALVALVPAGRALDQAAAMLPATSGV
jgi:hypothetical protein